MPLDFRLENVTVTEFGVGRETEAGSTYAVVPVDSDVQAALREMASTTWNAMKGAGDPAPYQASEKHGSTEYLCVEHGSELEAVYRQLHDAVNLTVDAGALNEPNFVLCYFARFADDQERRLTAVRRAGQFKGILKSRLLRIVGDALKIVADDVFKLDNDFDILVDSSRTHIWRPSAFEFVGGLKQAVLDAVPSNAAAIEQDVPFVDFGSIATYASTRSRAARYLASIRTQNLMGIERQSVVALCQNTGVEVEDVDGVLRLEDRHVMGFLEVLDRRRYEVELVPGTRERFRAASRRPIQGM